MLWERESQSFTLRFSGEAEPEELISWFQASSGGSNFPVFLLDGCVLPDAAERLDAEARRTWALSLPWPPGPVPEADGIGSPGRAPLGKPEPVLSSGLVLGILFLAASALSALSAHNRLEAYETASIRLYREVFDPTGPLRDPLSQAKARLAAVSGTDETEGLLQAFAMLGRASRKSGEGIVLDTLRYSERQTEAIGKGPSVEAVRAFQQALEAGETSLEDLQQLPGGQFRFKITVRGKTGERTLERTHGPARTIGFVNTRHPGARRILALAVLTCLAWGSGLFLQHRAHETEGRIPLAAARFASLAETAQAYRAVAPSSIPGKTRPNPADPLAAASETIDRLQIKTG